MYRLLLTMLSLFKRTSSARFFGIGLVTLIKLIVITDVVGVWGIAHPKSTLPLGPRLVERDISNTNPFQSSGTRRLTIETIFNGTFSPRSTGVDWFSQADDGIIATREGTFIQLLDLKTNETKVIFDTQDAKNEDGQPLEGIIRWTFSSGMKHILFQTNSASDTKGSRYYVHNVKTAVTRPIIPPTGSPSMSLAIWSPNGESIAFIHSNDIYVLPNLDPSTSPIRVTTSGNDTVFHGFSSQTYYRVLSDPITLWWSPDSRRLAFLRLDETSVNDYKIPIYYPSDDSKVASPYPTETVMKFPKPGYANPLASMHVFDVQGHINGSGKGSSGSSPIELDWSGRHSANNSLIHGAAWVANSTLVVKEVNRGADAGNVVVFDFDAEGDASKAQGVVVRKLGKDGEEGDNGWIDERFRVTPVISNGNGAYLDIVPTKDGYNHIALFATAKTTTPRFLTSGAWEVLRINAVDEERRLVYFSAARPSPIEQQLYSIRLPQSDTDIQEVAEPTALTDVTQKSLYDASFSSRAGFYSLSYRGPGVPWQKIVKVDDAVFERILEKNEGLATTMKEFEWPTISEGTIDSEGYELDYREYRPPHMDESGRTKYPVLFNIYNGPGSQMVNFGFSVDWNHYVACRLGYIVVVVDGRGTGTKGRKHRNPVKDNIGFYEVKDQVNAARVWAAKDFVDSKKIGIMGPSFGGYLTSKVVEADAGVHSLAIAIAPVTDWRLYNSFYSERYMNLLQLNEQGYTQSAVSNMTGFHKVDYLLVHGSGDSNVHFAHSARLLDLLTQAKVRNFTFRMFTDGDHDFYRRGVRQELHEYFEHYLVQKWGTYVPQ
ncbi:hypothetical protein HGRIS_005588 [Hohenbuehelia grisea]|uniref:Dipeptidyl-peptidase IV n=1 Tax=Hohenbuehelia grisea TaxID=104357 RepID=A0ABR3JZC5_9AGAR